MPAFFFVKQSFISDFKFESKAVQNVSYELSEWELTVEVTYNQTLERESAKISFNLNDAYFRGPIFYEQTFTVKTDEKELLFS